MLTGLPSRIEVHVVISVQSNLKIRLNANISLTHSTKCENDEQSLISPYVSGRDLDLAHSDWAVSQRGVGWATWPPDAVWVLSLSWPAWWWSISWTRKCAWDKNFAVFWQRCQNSFSKHVLTKERLHLEMTQAWSEASVPIFLTQTNPYWAVLPTLLTRCAFWRTLVWTCKIRPSPPSCGTATLASWWRGGTSMFTVWTLTTEARLKSIRKPRFLARLASPELSRNLVLYSKAMRPRQRRALSTSWQSYMVRSCSKTLVDTAKEAKEKTKETSGQLQRRPRT